MKYFCTVSDMNYLPQGLSMYRSMMEYSKDFILYYLCLDLESYDVLEDLIATNGYKNIIPVYEPELGTSPEYVLLQTVQPSMEAINVASRTGADAQYIQRCWASAPFFTFFCAEELGCSEITYIDADIYFFDSWKNIQEYMLPDQSVGLVRHRIPRNPDVGEFNVGVVSFNCLKEEGYRCLKLWKDCVIGLHPEHEEEYGKCGDQGYLELLYNTEPHVYALDDANFGHMAPWNFHNHHINAEKNTIIYDGEEQALTYIHFSNFKPDYDSDTYQMAPRHGVITHNSNYELKKYYGKYFRACKSANQDIIKSKNKMGWK